MNRHNCQNVMKAWFYNYYRIFNGIAAYAMSATTIMPLHWCETNYSCGFSHL